MRRKIIIGAIFFIVGIGVSILPESFLRSNVLNLYQWTTNGRIQFAGKNFYLFASPIYYLSFGFVFLFLALDFLTQESE